MQFTVATLLSSKFLVQLEGMKKYLKNDEYEAYKTTLKNNWDGLQTINEKIFVPMYGYKNLQELAEYSSLVKLIDKIKVPIFALTAKDDAFFNDEFVPKK